MSEPVDPNAPGVAPTDHTPDPVGGPPTGPPTFQSPSAGVGTPDPPKGGTGRALMIGLAAGLVVVLVAAATAWFLLRPKNHELGGSMSVFDTDYMSSNAGSSCSGKGGYSDINSGGQVTVKDGKGTTLAVGRLGQGKLLSLDEVANQNGLTTTTTKRSTSSSSDNSPIVCQFPVIVTDIPDADFYRVEIGRRSPVEYSKADLESQSWKLSLTLGP